MATILDARAPNEAAEYARYLDGDLMGKILARNYLVNRIGYSSESVFTPLGRYGDARVKYSESGIVRDPGDGHVNVGDRRVTFEVKFARINMAGRARGATAKNWAFVNLKQSPGKSEKKYDILIAVGLLTLGLEDDGYWSNLDLVVNELQAQRLPGRTDAMPHEVEFLSICSFFVLPMTKLPTNYFRINLDSVDASAYGSYRAWGHDEARCKKVWNNAMAMVLEA